MKRLNYIILVNAVIEPGGLIIASQPQQIFVAPQFLFQIYVCAGVRA
jgi:hypothetical protein